MIEITSAIIMQAILMFVLAWILLFALYYFTTPSYLEYGDKNSRYIYCAIYSLVLALVLAVGFAILPEISLEYGLVQALIVGLVMVFIFTFIQAYIIRELAKRGMISIRRKARK
ncbi:hypothetical protein CUJ83_06365 [Methanocella sp. CWC-04]|uniref:Uncharacterized protein n=1 Tax=Methanooceanicella nereidis TaxID=2052831 RepID=A0AAP2RCK5_9EURY|nr:hypothetical protein [Methanocella sp. CWC-04]MCD1294622.1 hypothetical protein [Methanocella sp. CWC-04]